MGVCQTCGKFGDVNSYQWAGDELVFCDGCAESAGFCPGCGGMAAGEYDDYLARYGLCYDCVHELRIETGEFDAFDDTGFEY